MSARPRRHDLSWRLAGLLLLAVGFACDAAGSGTSSGLSLAGFALAIAGLVLVVQGGRVPVALRVERSRHRDLPMAIHSRRLANRHVRSRQIR